jgi:hypothetical protein
MITFITTVDHQYTIDALRGEGSQGPVCRSMAYDELFAASELAPGVYVFTDFERMSAIELQAAAGIFRRASQAPNIRCLNDPARAKLRFALLRALKEAGLNDFDAYPANSRPRPGRFPVFVRDSVDHGLALGPLLRSQAELDAALIELPAAGVPLGSLVVIEFCGEPFRDNVWRRWGAFRVGAAIHLDHAVSETSWMVKSGTSGLVDDEVYRQDDRMVRENAFADEIRKAFQIAGIDYGRADLAMVGGRVQVYEINTNPHIGELKPLPSATRAATMDFARQRLLRHLSALDMPSEGPPAAIDFVTENLEPDLLRKRARAVRELRAELAALRASVDSTRRERDATVAALEAERAAAETKRRRRLGRRLEAAIRPLRRRLRSGKP